MAIISLNRSRRGGSDWRRALLIVAALLVLVVGGSFWNRTLERMVLAVARPFLQISNHLTQVLGNASSALRSKQALLSENDQLKRRLLETQTSLEDHQVIERDNALLRQEIGLLRDEPFTVVAEILSHPWNSPLDIILATIPSDALVVTGDLVTFNKNVWAGEVINRTERVVKIKLISSPDTPVPVLIGADNIAAVASGRGGGNLEVALPRNLDIKIGDPVMAASSSLPLVVGTVGGIENNPSESLQEILIQTPINLALVRYLEIHAQ